MITKTHFKVTVSTKAKVLSFEATSVELDIPTGQIVILIGHIPVIGSISKTGHVTIREFSGATTVLNLSGGLFALDHNCNLTIIKAD